MLLDDMCGNEKVKRSGIHNVESSPLDLCGVMQGPDQGYSVFEIEGADQSQALSWLRRCSGSAQCGSANGSDKALVKVAFAHLPGSTRI